MKSSAFKRLFSYLKKYKIRLVFILIAAIISTFFTILAPTVTGMVTSELYEGVATGVFDWHIICTLLIGLVMIYLISQLFSILQNFNMTKVMAETMKNLRSDIDKKMHRAKLNYYDTRTNGEILSTITNDVDTINNALGQNLTQIVTQIFTAVGILIMMLKINTWLAMIAILMVPISLIASMGVMKTSRKHFADQQKYLGELNGYVEEMYNGQALIQTYNYKERAKEEFAKINSSLQYSAQRASIASSSITPLTGLVNNLGYAVSAVLGCLLVLKGKMRIGEVQAMLQYTKDFSQPFSSIANMAGSFGSAVAAANRVFELLDAEEETPNPEIGQQPENPVGSVEFRHVRFGYTPDKVLMKDVNIKVKPGQKVAIVGPTGAGKTTLINLLMRFYDVNSGAIIIDDVDIRNMNRNEMRDRFGMVLQDTWLFSGTIMDNIRYAEDNMSEEKAITAAQSASADGFIRTLPGAYDMVLSHGAENISQGQRQLLTIARAIASDPEIMILDEATSNVDTHTEQLIQNAMNELMKGRTSFVIAHRLSTIRDADMILYMENGDIKEVGNHETLMKLNGKYAALYNSQFA